MRWKTYGDMRRLRGREGTILSDVILICDCVSCKDKGEETIVLFVEVGCRSKSVAAMMLRSMSSAVGV